MPLAPSAFITDWTRSLGTSKDAKEQVNTTYTSGRLDISEIHPISSMRTNQKGLQGYHNNNNFEYVANLRPETQSQSNHRVAIFSPQLLFYIKTLNKKPRILYFPFASPSINPFNLGSSSAEAQNCDCLGLGVLTCTIAGRSRCSCELSATAQSRSPVRDSLELPADEYPMCSDSFGGCELTVAILPVFSRSFGGGVVIHICFAHAGISG